MGRDGFTEYKNTTDFAEQWQVKDTDEMLFHQVRAPQYPQKCIMPQAQQANKIRRLTATISKEQAIEACAHWSVNGQDACIFDVMTTGDLEMAEEPF
jgi:hypothetical protein